MAHGDLIPGSVVEMGKIKIGTLDPSKSFPGVKLEEFLITTVDRDDRGVLIPDTDLMNALAEFRDKDARRRLRTIPILFPSNIIADVLNIRFEWWPGKSRIGATTPNLIGGDMMLDRSQLDLTYYCDPKTGQALNEPRVVDWNDDLLDLPNPDPKQKGKPLLTLSTTLSVNIASTQARFGGVYRFRTKGWHSTNQLLSSLQFAKRLTCGVLRGPVFRLKVQPKTVRPNGQVGVAQVVHVEPAVSDLLQLREEARSHVLYERENMLMIRETEQQYKQLPAAVIEDEGDDEPVEPKKPGDPPLSEADHQAEVDRLDKIEKGIAACNTVDAINDFWALSIGTPEVWSKLDEAQRAAVKDMWGKRKTAILHPPVTTAAPPPDAEPPPDESNASAPASTAKAGKNIVAEIEKLCVEKSGTWSQFREQHGIAATRVKDLTADEALKVHAMLKGESAGAA